MSRLNRGSSRRATRSAIQAQSTRINGNRPNEVLPEFFEDSVTIPNQMPVHIKHRSAVIVDYQTTRLSYSKLRFEIHWNRPTKKAYFRLVVPIHLKGNPNPLNLFLYIPPDRIDRLSVKAGPAKIFCKDTRTFAFQLSRPPYLVAPRDLHLDNLEYATPEDNVNDIIDLLRTLAIQVYFFYHVPIAPAQVPLNELQSLVSGISAGEIATLSTITDLSSLYGGYKTARLIEGAELPPVAQPNQENIANPIDIPQQQPSSRQPAMASSSRQPTVASSSRQPAVASSSRQPAVASSSRQPAMASSSRQPAVASSSRQPAIASSSRQPAVASSSRQPAMASSSRQPLAPLSFGLPPFKSLVPGNNIDNRVLKRPHSRLSIVESVDDLRSNTSSRPSSRLTQGSTYTEDGAGLTPELRKYLKGHFSSLESRIEGQFSSLESRIEGQFSSLGSRIGDLETRFIALEDSINVRSRDTVDKRTKY